MRVLMSFETRLARIAPQTMSVGILWFASGVDMDRTLDRTFDAIDDDFPFLKKGLLLISSGRQDPQSVRTLLNALELPA